MLIAFFLSKSVSNRKKFFSFSNIWNRWKNSCENHFSNPEQFHRLLLLSSHKGKEASAKTLLLLTKPQLYSICQLKNWFPFPTLRWTALKRQSPDNHQTSYFSCWHSPSADDSNDILVVKVSAFLEPQTHNVPTFLGKNFILKSATFFNKSRFLYTDALISELAIQ